MQRNRFFSTTSILNWMMSRKPNSKRHKSKDTEKGRMSQTSLQSLTTEKQLTRQNKTDEGRRNAFFFFSAFYTWPISATDNRHWKMMRCIIRPQKFLDQIINWGHFQNKTETFLMNDFLVNGSNDFEARDRWHSAILRNFDTKWNRGGSETKSIRYKMKNESVLILINYKLVMVLYR